MEKIVEPDRRGGLSVFCKHVEAHICASGNKGKALDPR